MKTPSVTITREMLGLISEIDEFKGEWKALGNLSPDRLQALKKVATIESIGSSTRIEGVRLTDREVEQLLSGLDKKSFGSRDEQEVAGYAAAMTVVFESFAEIPLTENYIKQLHKILLQYSSKDSRHRGQYKKMPNHVEAFDHDGQSLGIIFETSAPFDTPADMSALVEWTGSRLEAGDLHPLLVVAIFTAHFLAIHPFQDGNGRLSRILTTLLLLKSGYAYVPYSSLESVIERNKENYYLALRKTQGTLKSKKAAYGPWIMFFFKSLKAQKDILAQKVARESALAGLPRLSMQIIELIKAHGQLSISEIASLTRANRNTIKVRLRELVGDKYLVKQGQGKATRYTSGSF